MTCVVGFSDGKTVWMGADSWGGSGQSGQVRKDTKVFLNGPFLIGYTTSFRMGQLLRFKFKPPARKTADNYRYMVTDVIDEVRRCLSEGGFSEKNNEVESGGSFLVGYNGRLYSIDSDYQVGIPLCGYTACGCGERFALGAMHASRRLSPARRIRAALEAAVEFSSGVRGPFTIRKL